MTTYIQKRCLFCQERESLKTLYPKNFDESNLHPDLFSARRTTEHFHYQIVRCQNCGLVFSREVLSDSSLFDLYEASHLTFGNYIPVIRKDYWRHLEPELKGRKRGGALEIGCSSGFFLEELKARGFEKVYGCEPSLEAKNKAVPDIRESIFQGLFQKGTFEPNSFDLICSFQTLDHLSEPLEAVRLCRDILRPGGLVYFICHDVDAPSAKLLGEKSPIMDIEHIYLFNKKTLQRLVEEAGFKTMKVGNIQNSYPLDYWIKMVPMPAPVKSFLSRFAALTGLGQLAVPIAAGNIYLIAERS